MIDNDHGVVEVRPGLQVVVLVGEGDLRGRITPGRVVTFVGDARASGAEGLGQIGESGGDRPAAVDEQLAEIPLPGLHLGDNRFPQGRIGLLGPAGDCHATAEDRFFAGIGGVSDRHLGGAGVLSCEADRLGDPIDAAADEDAERFVESGHCLVVANGVAGAFQCGLGAVAPVGRRGGTLARPLIVAVGGDVEVGRGCLGPCDRYRKQARQQNHGEASAGHAVLLLSK